VTAVTDDINLDSGLIAEAGSPARRELQSSRRMMTRDRDLRCFTCEEGAALADVVESSSRYRVYRIIV